MRDTAAGSAATGAQACRFRLSRCFSWLWPVAVAFGHIIPRYF